jgi:hypothetical protein
MRRQRLSNIEAITASPMRPACPFEPMGTKPAYMPIEDRPYRPTSPQRDNGPGPERFAGANIELCNHKGVLRNAD